VDARHVAVGERLHTHTYLHFLERELQQEAAAPQRTNEGDLVVEYFSLVVDYLILVAEYLILVVEYLSLPLHAIPDDTLISV